MSFTLGTAPVQMTVVLAADADFVSSLTSTTGSWPGTGLALKLVDRAGVIIDTWEATIVGAVVSWNVDAAVVASVLAGGARTARLHYVDDDGVDLLWARGEISRA